MTAQDGIARFEHWARMQALPLWASAGFDRAAGLFEERLDFTHAPVPVPRRLMVQARQVAVYAQASRRGWYPEGALLALAVGRRMVEHYLESDGAPGWVFSIDREGRPANRTRDLYAHAFVLFALAWLIRLEPDPVFRSAVSATLAFLDETMADPVHGGYWDALPGPDKRRRQNPHMHLYEALLELYEVLGETVLLDRVARLRTLAVSRFIVPASGMLFEYFDGAWTVPVGADSIEPGHLFEWAWLLRRHDALAGTEPDGISAELLAAGLRHGFDGQTGRIVDELDRQGRIKSASSRLWPHTEALKILAVDRTGGHEARIARILDRLLGLYCPDRLGGGWIDQFDAADQPVSTDMPASSLYHLMWALGELCVHARGAW